ncbi:MAG: hypothetical protein C0502_02510 [Opitutus sp.]|nr:hypothetical protein [Opitutus sp.]
MGDRGAALDESPALHSLAAVTAVVPVAPRPFRFTRGIAALCAGAVWLLGVLAISPQLHDHVHEDAAAPHHECAVTLFQHGAENPLAFSRLSVAPAEFAVATLAPTDSIARPAADVRLQPGRGPPRR